ncbi:MAG: ribosomal RNA small subunit methyltransferase A [Saprospiraceae bacterium]|nr:ribosomal RNA small subunit methyltransferase A [Bacteroidia bacterium]NNL92422.1 ribosomal RNA small subunit methyltransferase A [Saprospiraceae bacterium]
MKTTDILKAKKHLGQHFLTNEATIDNIVALIKEKCPKDMPILEVGPGQGVLTFRLDKHFTHFKASEFDRDMIRILTQQMDEEKIIKGDFLKLDLKNIFDGQPFALVGNFPYNISSQIIFKMLENLDYIPIMIGMFQKEVAERICSNKKGKQNGILSLNAQAYYETNKMFDIPPEAFSPPPKVNSSIIYLNRLEDYTLKCDAKLYSKVIKLVFQQRRKKLRNTLKPLLEDTSDELFHMRPEQLSVEDFVNIANRIEEQNKKK